MLKISDLDKTALASRSFGPVPLHPLWTDLACDSTPDYNDTQPHPAALTTWKYRAIWRAGEDDAQIGLWSLVVSIVVGGDS